MWRLMASTREANPPVESRGGGGEGGEGGEEQREVKGNRSEMGVLLEEGDDDDEVEEEEDDDEAERGMKRCKDSADLRIFTLRMTPRTLWMLVEAWVLSLSERGIPKGDWE